MEKYILKRHPIVLYGLLVRHDVENHACLNFWDDPTHIRPWNPAAFYRLAISFGCTPIKCAYIKVGFKKIFYWFQRLYGYLKNNGDTLTNAVWAKYEWCCYAVIEKPADLQGKSDYQYISLKGVPRGINNALKLYRDLQGRGTK